MTLLDIRNLTVRFATRRGAFTAVDGIDVAVQPNEVLAIVGESGSGKSVAMLAIMGLLPWTATVTADRMAFDGQDLRTLSPRQRRALVGRDIAMVFQEPMSSLNPCFTVGWQIAEALGAHLPLARAARRQRAIELLEEVGIPDAPRRASAFPHQLSGGMCQRVMIAMALACRPRLLIADEPTTALDVTIQAQILDLLLGLRRQTGMALVLITHDLGVVAETADRVSVQYSGRQVEQATAADLFADPHHPYTAALLAALPENAAVTAQLAGGSASAAAPSSATAQPQEPAAARSTAPAVVAAPVAHPSAAAAAIAQRSAPPATLPHAAVALAPAPAAARAMPQTSEAPQTPQPPSTMQPVAAVVPLRRLAAIPGMVPGQFDRPPGCLFAPRCRFVIPVCQTPPPPAPEALGRALCHIPLVHGVPT